jgi:surface polysaccharide O-acyltransferase-like enzyme
MSEMPNTIVAAPAKVRGDSGVELFRFVLALLVITLHSIPVSVPARDPTYTPDWALFLSTLDRAAVPFFFIASGFYMRRGPDLRTVLLKPVRRILTVYVVAFAGVAAALWLFPVKEIIYTPLNLLRGDAIGPLWFMPALAGSLVLVATGRHWLGDKLTFICAAALAVAGPLAYAYFPVLGLHGYYWRMVPLVRQMPAPLLVWLGVWLAGRERLRIAPALLGFGASLALLFAEQALVSHLHDNRYIVSYDMLAATFALGIFTFLLARSISVPAPLARLGELSLTIYLVHIFFVWAARYWLGDAADFASCARLVALAAAGSIVTALAVKVFAKATKPLFH